MFRYLKPAVIILVVAVMALFAVIQFARFGHAVIYGR